MDLEASEISISPIVNLLKPPPVPETPTSTFALGCNFLNYSATASYRGDRVDDPSTSTVPLNAVDELDS